MWTFIFSVWIIWFWKKVVYWWMRGAQQCSQCVKIMVLPRRQWPHVSVFSALTSQSHALHSSTSPASYVQLFGRCFYCTDEERSQRIVEIPQKGVKSVYQLLYKNAGLEIGCVICRAEMSNKCSKGETRMGVQASERTGWANSAELPSELDDLLVQSFCPSSRALLENLKFCFIFSNLRWVF